jgi:hypothetical protein
VPHRPPFDPNRPLVAAREFLFAGLSYKKGDPFPGPSVAPGISFPRRLIERQYNAGAVNHEDPGKAGPDGKAAEDDSPVKLIKGAKNGYWSIAAPWLEAPLEFRGEHNAKAAFAELKEEGPPLGWIDGGTETEIMDAGDGTFLITAPWLSEPEKVEGDRAAAETRQREIHEAGPPEGFGAKTEPKEPTGNQNAGEDAGEANSDPAAGEADEGEASGASAATDAEDSGNPGDGSQQEPVPADEADSENSAKSGDETAPQAVDAEETATETPEDQKAPETPAEPEKAPKAKKTGKAKNAKPVGP